MALPAIGSKILEYKVQLPTNFVQEAQLSQRPRHALCHSVKILSTAA